MTTLETNTPTALQAILAVMRDVTAVGKTGRNVEQDYHFRGIDAVVNAVGPRFRDHGIIPVPILETVNYRDVRTSRDKPAREVTVQVRYRFHGPLGDYVDVVVPGESMDSGDKGTAKSMSVAYRIALLQLLCLPTTEPDPDSQTYERSDDNTDYPSLIAAAESAGDRAALLSLWRTARKYRPDDTGLLGAIKAAGDRLKAAAEPPSEDEPGPDDAVAARVAGKSRRELERHLFALLKEGQVPSSDRAVRLRVLSRLCNRVPVVTTMGELADGELSGLVVTLDRWRRDEQLVDHLAEIIAAAPPPESTPDSPSPATTQDRIGAVSPE